MAVSWMLGALLAASCPAQDAVLQAAATAIQAQWQATARAARSLDADLGQSLEQVLREALQALEQRPFAQRLRGTPQR